jgi:SNF2 family DNA or RNA helicase
MKDETAMLKSQKIEISSEDSQEMIPAGKVADLTTTYVGASAPLNLQTQSIEQKLHLIVCCIKPFILRRDASFLEKSIPPTTEYIVKANMSKM